MVKQKARERLARRLGRKIATSRQTRKWSQEDLAERLGVASETISRFERGATVPSLVTLQRVADVLKTPLADLLAHSSSSPDDQATVIATWLVGLSDDDRDYVLDLVKTSCDYLRRRR